MIFLLMAAHDTTAIAMSMLVYELGRNQHWQNVLRDEALHRPVESPPLTDLLRAFHSAQEPDCHQVYASVRLHDWWPDPDTFNPDRFAGTAQHEVVSRYVFAPFGGGAHKCIGQQFADMTVKTVMHQLLRRFVWSTPTGYVVPLTWGTGPTPADALPTELSHRVA